MRPADMKRESFPATRATSWARQARSEPLSGERAGQLHQHECFPHCARGSSHEGEDLPVRRILAFDLFAGNGKKRRNEPAMVMFYRYGLDHLQSADFPKPCLKSAATEAASTGFTQSERFRQGIFTAF